MKTISVGGKTSGRLKVRSESLVYLFNSEGQTVIGTTDGRLSMPDAAGVVFDIISEQWGDDDDEPSADALTSVRGDVEHVDD